MGRKKQTYLFYTAAAILLSGAIVSTASDHNGGDISLPEGSTPTELKAESDSSLLRTDSLAKTRQKAAPMSGAPDITVPDMPVMTGYAPVAMASVSEASPADGLQLISLPSPNNSGSASLSYAIELPPVRNGIAPSVVISYDSDAGDGLLGEGWDMGIPGIDVSTRFGVPAYDPLYESEHYTLNGSDLALDDPEIGMWIPSRPGQVDRVSGRRFHTRRAGDFSRIIREGSGLDDSGWTVTDRGATVYRYGSDADSRLSDSQGHTARWLLKSVRELHGDSVTWTYRRKEDALSEGVKVYSVLLDHINVYLKDYPGEYMTIRFNYIDKTSASVMSGRNGFLVSNKDLLSAITVNLMGEEVRSYLFDYERGWNGRELLKTISMRVPGIAQPMAHHLDYYQPETETSPLLSKRKAISLNSSSFHLGKQKTNSFGSNFYLGVGFGTSISKQNTAGVSAGFSTSGTDEKNICIDIDGDGLSDFLYENGGKVYMLRQLAKMEFSEPIELPGLKGLGESSVVSGSAGASANIGIWGVGATVGYDHAWSKSKTTKYFADINGDGLPDYVEKGRVYYNQPDINGVPSFSTALPWEAGYDSPGLSEFLEDKTTLEKEEQDSVINQSPRIDIVRFWEAPRNGSINISSTASCVGMEQTPTGDGMDLMIVAPGVSKSIHISPGEFNALNIPSTVPVKKGDRVYFRTSSGSARDADGTGDSIQWLPVITYANMLKSSRAPGFDTYYERDASGIEYERFRGSQDFIPAGSSPLLVQGGKFSVTHTIKKGITNDSITLRAIYQIPDTTGKTTERVLWKKRLGCEAFTGSPISYYEDIPDGYIRFEAIADSEIDWSQFSWKPSVKDQNQKVERVLPHILCRSVRVREGEQKVVKWMIPFLSTKQGDDAKINIDCTAPKDLSARMRLTLKTTTGPVMSKELSFKNGKLMPSEIPIQDFKSVVGDSIRLWAVVSVDTTVSVVKNILETLSVKLTTGIKAFPVLYPIDNIEVQQAVSVTPIQINEFIIKPQVDAFADSDTYGPMFKGWGSFAFNRDAAEKRGIGLDNLFDTDNTLMSAMEDIDFSALESSPNDSTLINSTVATIQATGASAENNVFFPLEGIALEDGTAVLRGPNNRITASASGFSCSRLREPSVIEENQFADAVSARARGEYHPIAAIVHESKANTSTVHGGLSAGVNATVSSSNASSSSKVTTADLNGDGFPDLILSGKKVIYSNPDGSYSSGDFQLPEEMFKSHSTGVHYGSGGEAMFEFPRSGNVGSAGNTASGEPANHGLTKKGGFLGGNSNLGHTDDNTKAVFTDINGDGLPDIVYNDERVRYNLGRGFTEPVPYTGSRVNSSHSKSFSGGISGGMRWGSDVIENLDLKSFNILESSFSGGLGGAFTTTLSGANYADLNGDGLPDLIVEEQSGADYNVRAFLNKGSLFNTRDNQNFATTTLGTETAGTSVNAAGTIGFSLFGVKLVTTLGVDAGSSTSVANASLLDFNGDGCAELVSTNPVSGTIQVLYSSEGKYNRLRKVTNPLGGEFTLDYEMTGGMPENDRAKLVLSSVTTDSRTKENGPDRKWSFDYSGYRYDRRNRVPLGYGYVKTNELGDDDEILRVTTTHYSNDNYFTAGLTLSSSIGDPEGNLAKNDSSEYTVTPVAFASNVYQFGSYRSNDLVKSVALSKSRSYEKINGSVLTRPEISYEYYNDATRLGAVKAVTLQNIRKTVYEYTPATEIYAPRVTDISVRTLINTLLSQKTAKYEDSRNPFAPTEIGQRIDASTVASTRLLYDGYGNLTKITGPANYRGQQLSYNITYDDETHQSPVSVRDVRGLTTSMEDIDYRICKPRMITDPNGSVSTYAYDPLGRLRSIIAPMEQQQELDQDPTFTLLYDYGRLPSLSPDSTFTPAYAVTSRYDCTTKGYIRSAIFADGFGGVAQRTAEDEIAEWDGKPEFYTIVSNLFERDCLGRVVKRWNNSVTDPGQLLDYNPFRLGNPTTLTYDVMDRVTSTTLPGGETTTTQYAIATYYIPYFETTVTDPLGRRHITLTDNQGRTEMTIEMDTPDGETHVSYAYDSMDRLMRVTDYDGNETESEYDMLGRRTSVYHPASGISNVKYDASGLIVATQNARQELRNEWTRMTYDYDRLISVIPDGNPADSVHYYYGAVKSQIPSQRGRLIRKEEPSGVTAYTYGLNGEITSSHTSLLVPFSGVHSFTTEDAYDSFGRLLRRTYEDQSHADYHYGAGGALRSVSYTRSGSDAVTDSVVITHNYLGLIEQTEASNGVVSRREYDTNRRLFSMTATLPGGTKFMDNRYKYDACGNITSLHDYSALKDHFVTGANRQFHYDSSNRLTSSQLILRGNTTLTNMSANTSYTYDYMGRILSSRVSGSQQGIGMEDAESRLFRNLQYEYDPYERFRLSTVTEVDNLGNNVARTSYSYDPCGNMIGSVTGLYMPDGHFEPRVSERRMEWDDFGRLRSVDENGFISVYLYNDGFDRRVKLLGELTALSYDGDSAAVGNSLSSFMLFPDASTVYNNDVKITRHIYAGSELVLSSVCNVDNAMGSNQAGNAIRNGVRLASLEDSIAALYARHNLPFRRPDFAARAAMRRASPVNPNPETFFYHSDHLGNTSFVTDRSGALTQHVEYLPFGEPLLEQRGSAGNWQTDRLFNSKEYDTETGLYYYGARYYDPRLAIWLSPDPLQEKYPNTTTYCYAFNNPISAYDPDGKENLIVVGSQNSDNPGSKLMFANQGIRAMREMSERWPSESRTMLLFKEGYSEGQIKAIQQSVTNYGGQLKLLDSYTEFANYINTKAVDGKGNARASDKITKMELYSHGLFGSIEFGYNTEKDDEYRLDFSNVSKLSKEAFKGTDSRIYSYACRTGIGKDFKYVGFYEFPISSLAQAISNATDATVFAFPVRTDYKTTLGKRTERHFGFPDPAPDTLHVDGAIFTPYGAAHRVRGGLTPLFLHHKMIMFTPIK